jgi:hypothetical protein
VAWIDGHHITHWRDGGTTSLDNTAALCANHHGVVHRTGWTLTTDPDGTHTITRPDGETLTSPPPRRQRPPTLPLHHRDRPPDPWTSPSPGTSTGDGDDLGHGTCAHGRLPSTITVRLPDEASTAGRGAEPGHLDADPGHDRRPAGSRDGTAPVDSNAGRGTGPRIHSGRYPDMVVELPGSPGRRSVTLVEITFAA